MDSIKVLAPVLAGGNGTRLHPLTAEHAKPALPFAAGYRIVDFVLSNLVNSGITPTYVLAQYKPQSIIEHIRAAWAPGILPHEERSKICNRCTLKAMRSTREMSYQVVFI